MNLGLLITEVPLNYENIFSRVNNGLYGNDGKKYGELKLFNDVVIHSSFQSGSFISV